MSKKHNPFLCLAVGGNETDPVSLAKQQKSTRSQNNRNGSKSTGNSAAASPSRTGLRICTQPPENNPRSDSLGSPMSPELLAALEASLLTAPAGSDGYSTPPRATTFTASGPATANRLIDDDPWASAYANIPPAAAVPPKHTPPSKFPNIQSSDHRSDFPPLLSSTSTSQVAGSPCSEASGCSASDSLWDSFTAVFDGTSPSPRLTGSAAEADEMPPLYLAGGQDEFAKLAAVTGMMAQELLLAQQTALLHELNNSRAKTNTKASSSGRQGSVRAVAAAVVPEEDFPALVSPAGCSASVYGPLNPGRSPHAVPAGWKSSHNKQLDKAVRVINTGASRDDCSTMRLSRLDLHWDLQLDGLRLKEEDADWELAQYEGLGGSYIADDEAAAAATRELLEQQQVAAEAAAARGSSSGGSSRDKYSKEAVWLQLSRSANRPGSTGSPYKGLASSAAYGTPVCDDEVQQVCGGRSYAGRYEWRPLLAAAKGRGWRPVDKRDGGGGTHIKLRRQVTLPGGSVHIQTMVLACTPGDSQRAIRNAASQFARQEQEREQLMATGGGDID